MASLPRPSQRGLPGCFVLRRGRAPTTNAAAQAAQAVASRVGPVCRGRPERSHAIEIMDERHGKVERIVLQRVDLASNVLALLKWLVESELWLRKFG